MATTYVVNCDVFAIVLDVLLFVVLWRLAGLIVFVLLLVKLCYFLAILYIDQ